MTLKQWLADNPVHFYAQAHSVAVYSYSPELWNLSDYVVSTVSGPVVWLTRRLNHHVVSTPERA